MGVLGTPPTCELAQQGRISGSTLLLTRGAKTPEIISRNLLRSLIEHRFHPLLTAEGQ
jgi:hypothetical protein